MRLFFFTSLLFGVLISSVVANSAEENQPRGGVIAFVDHFHQSESARLSEMSEGLFASDGEGTKLWQNVLSEEDKRSLSETRSKIAKLRKIADGNQPKLDELEAFIDQIYERNTLAVKQLDAKISEADQPLNHAAAWQSESDDERTSLPSKSSSKPYDLDNAYLHYFAAKACAAAGATFSDADIASIEAYLKQKTRSSALTSKDKDQLWRSHQIYAQNHRYDRIDCRGAAGFYAEILRGNLTKNTTANPFQ